MPVPSAKTRPRLLNANVAFAAATKKPDGTIRYEVVKTGTNESVIDYTEEVASMIGPKNPGSAAQLAVEYKLPLKDLAPGQYTLKLTVTDKKRNQTLTPSAPFTVN